MNENVVTDEYINNDRQVQFDYMKFFSILFMILIHVFEDLSVYWDGVDPGVFGTVLSFLGGPLAAPVFMFAMGIGMAYTSHSTPKEMFIRGLKLFIFGYILNLLRDGIRDFIVLGVYGEFDMQELLNDLFMIDIMHFAGLSYMLVALFKKMKLSNLTIVIIALVIQAIGYSLVDITTTDNNSIKYILGLFMYTCEASLFPLTLWFVYPAIGMFAGDKLRKTKDQNKWYKRLLISSFVLLIVILVILKALDISPIIFYTLEDDLHYKQNIVSLIINLNIAAFYTSLFYFFSKTSLSKKIEDKIVYIGSHLNEIYINQWILIGLFAYLQEFEVISMLEYKYVIPLGLIIWIISILLAKYTKIFTKKYL